MGQCVAEQSGTKRAEQKSAPTAVAPGWSDASASATAANASATESARERAPWRALRAAASRAADSFAADATSVAARADRRRTPASYIPNTAV